MSCLPSLVALFDRGCLANVAQGSRKGYLEFSTKDELVVNPISHFVIVPSTTDGLVHIRSSYNNKYLRSESADSKFIVAAGREPEEDKSLWNCTLFKFKLRIVTSTYTYVSFFHVATNYLAVSRDGIDGQDFLGLSNVEDDVADFFLVDVELVVKLPKRVTFKGYNGNYLRGRDQDGHEYNEFTAENNLEKTTHYEIVYCVNGNIGVKSLHYNKYLRAHGYTDWILATATQHPSSILFDGTLFEVVKVGSNVVALRSTNDPRRFAKRLTDEDRISCLSLSAVQVEADARLEVEEPVISRDIEVHYRLDDNIVHEKIPLVVASYTVPNGTDEAQEIMPGMTFSKTHISTWSNTASIKLGTKATFSTGIPFFVKGEFEVSAEFTEEMQFGSSNDFSKEVSSQYKVIVPPSKKAIINVLAFQAKYDIPFSYTQTDIYSTGERVVTIFEDGVYHGVEAYDFRYETIYEPYP